MNSPYVEDRVGKFVLESYIIEFRFTVFRSELVTILRRFNVGNVHAAVFYLLDQNPPYTEKPTEQ